MARRSTPAWREQRFSLRMPGSMSSRSSIRYTCRRIEPAKRIIGRSPSTAGICSHYINKTNPKTLKP
eukprot:1531866-Pyramimonas_sp.AAC.2